MEKLVEEPFSAKKIAEQMIAAEEGFTVTTGGTKVALENPEPLRSPDDPATAPGGSAIHRRDSTHGARPARRGIGRRSRERDGRGRQTDG